MKLLITGGSGYAGSHLVRLAQQFGHQLSYTYFSADPLSGGVQIDLRRQDDVVNLVRELRPDVIVHMAGSNRSADMVTVIEEGTRAVVTAAEVCRARLIFMSTDVLFDGTSAPYKEEDPPTPPHPYGRAKANAEKIVAQWPNHVIVRPSLIYGLKQMDLGTTWMARSIKAGEQVTLFTDQWRSPVWVETLGQACLELAENEFVGILHVAGSQPLTRAEFGVKMLAWWGIEDRGNLRLAPTPTDAPWPLNTVLDITRAKRLLKTPFPGVNEVLEQGKIRSKMG
ncbi:MAG: SDR family oxidoreductase [Ardenticatenaceae bacterium]|nr:SDR family oxidoreductase [Ardenticatenaceae bacterium]